MQIFSATVEDARRIAEIHVSTWQAAYVGIVPADFLAGLSVDQREAYWRQEIPLGKQQVALVKVGDAVLGWVWYGSSCDADALPGAAEIWAIYVAPEHWYSGAGRRLCVHARAQLVQQSFQSM